MSETNGQKVRVTHGQFFRLCEWLKANQERLASIGPTLKEASIMAEKDLGFKVSPTTVGKARGEAGVVWESPHSANGRRVAGLRAITAAVVELYRRLGEKLPDYLAANAEE